MTIAASHIFKRSQFIAKTIYLIHKCLFLNILLSEREQKYQSFLIKKNNVLSSSIIIHGNNCTFLKFNIININFNIYLSKKSKI